MCPAGTPKFRVLVVDDEEDVREILKTILQTKYEVALATNGLDALLKLSRYQPDVIIADVMMPLLDGYELVTRVRKTSGYENIPIILVSALDDREEMKKGYSRGADVYLSKPFDPDRVVRNVDISLEGRHPSAKSLTIRDIEKEFQEKRAPVPPKDTAGKEYQLLKHHHGEESRPPASSPAVPRPSSPAPVAPDRPAAPHPPAKPRDPNDPKPRVLIVDDDPAIIELIESAFKSTYEIVPAFDGLDAVRRIPHAQPDVYIVDGMMPKMSGYQLVEILKGSSETHRAPIIFISAKNLPRDRVMLAKRGVDIFIPKPFTVSQLAEALDIVTGHPSFRVHHKDNSFDDVMKEVGKKVEKMDEIKSRKNHWDTISVIQEFLEENKKADPFRKGGQ